MVKFVNESNLRRIVNKIKTALDTKQNSRLVVTYLGGNDADIDYVTIWNAIEAGREVVVKYGYKEYKYCYNDSGWLYFTVVADGYYYELRTNDEEKWNSRSFQVQNTLVSGTNIKTLNGASLLGSGNVANKFIVTITQVLPIGGGSPTYSVSPKFSTILNKINAGFEVVCEYGTYVYQLESYNNSSIRFSLTDAEDGAVETFEVTSSGVTFYSSSFQSYEHLVVNEDPTGGSQTIDNPELLNKIESISTTQSTASGGTNTVTITETNGTSTSFNVLNGINGGSLGDVDIVDVTGDRTDAVMSQKGVTEYGMKLLDEEAVDGSGTMMRKILTSLGWEFDKYTQASGNLASSTNTVVTPYIEIGECGNHIIEAAYFLDASATRYVVFFNSNKTSVTYFQQYEQYRYFHTLGDVSTKYVRYTVHVDRIRDCYIYDHTAKQFLFKGDEYLDNIINNYNVSYGYIGDKNVLKHTFIKPTCFSGTLCYYKLSQFPNLDPRTCDGLSVALDGYMNSGPWDNLPFLLMHTGSSIYNNDNYFAIASNWGAIKCGVLTNYYNTVVNGCSLTGTNTRFAHLVITFDFKTGTVTSYNNGVLSATNTPETYSESDLRTFLNSCTELYLGWNLKTACMAVFPYVLTSDDVKSIYGIGASSTKGELIPDLWNANILHPQTYSGQNIGIYLYNTNIVRSNDGDAAVLTSNATTAQFGFTGIQGTINNHIYEWEMEVVSGTWTQYSRGMIYNNNYYKVVNIYDSNGNDVSYNDLTVGNYHVVCKPDNILARNINAGWNCLNYIFTTTKGAVMKVTNLKVVEKGAALICGINNFRGNYFEQKNSNKVPVAREFYPYRSTGFADYYTTYKEDIIEYSSSTPVQFTGQMAVSVANNKVYVGYLTGAGTGTWKQINNS